MYKKIEELLATHSRESGRLSFHADWKPDDIYPTLCAFANDLYKVGGGHIVLGVEKEQPVKGLSEQDIARIQEEMSVFNKLISPSFHPQSFIEKVNGCLLLGSGNGSCSFMNSSVSCSKPVSCYSSNGYGEEPSASTTFLNQIPTQ